MQKSKYYKWAIMLFQLTTIGVMLSAFGLQRYFLQNYKEHMVITRSLDAKFADKLLEAQKAGNTELQTTLVDGFLKIEQETDQHFLEGTEHLQGAFRMLYLGVIGINVLGVIILWFSAAGAKRET